MTSNCANLDMGFINNWVSNPGRLLMGWKFRWNGQKNPLIFNSFDILSSHGKMSGSEKCVPSSKLTKRFSLIFLVFFQLEFRWQIFGRLDGLIFQKYWLSGHLLSHHCPICLLRMIWPPYLHFESSERGQQTTLAPNMDQIQAELHFISKEQI